MNVRYLKSFAFVATLALSLGFQSCVGDLDVTPIDPSTKMDFERDAVFNKIYATLGLTGQKGADGDGEVDDIPEQAFLNVGPIEDAIRRGEEMLAAISEAK